MYIHLIPIFLADPMFKKFACSSLSCFITYGFQHGLFSISDAIFLWGLISLPGIIQPNQPTSSIVDIEMGGSFVSGSLGLSLGSMRYPKMIIAISTRRWSSTQIN